MLEDEELEDSMDRAVRQRAEGFSQQRFMTQMKSIVA